MKPQQSLVNILQEEAIDPSSLDIKVVTSLFLKFGGHFSYLCSLILMGVFFFILYKQRSKIQFFLVNHGPALY